MTQKYINTNFEIIKKYVNITEARPDDLEWTKDYFRENRLNLEMFRRYGCRYILIGQSYKIDIEL